MPGRQTHQTHTWAYMELTPRPLFPYFVLTFVSNVKVFFSFIRRHLTVVVLDYRGGGNQNPLKGLNAHKGKSFTGRLVFYQAKEMGINCLCQKQIQQTVPMPAHLVNQRHPHPPTAEGHGKK